MSRLGPDNGFTMPPRSSNSSQNSPHHSPPLHSVATYDPYPHGMYSPFSPPSPYSHSQTHFHGHSHTHPSYFHRGSPSPPLHSASASASASGHRSPLASGSGSGSGSRSPISLGSRSPTGFGSRTPTGNGNGNGHGLLTRTPSHHSLHRPVSIMANRDRDRDRGRRTPPEGGIPAVDLDAEGSNTNTNSSSSGDASAAGHGGGTGSATASGSGITGSGNGNGTGNGTGNGNGSGSKTPRKGKVVQWLDHHLNSQAQQAQQAYANANAAQAEAHVQELQRALLSAQAQTHGQELEGGEGRKGVEERKDETAEGREGKEAPSIDLQDAAQQLRELRERELSRLREQEMKVERANSGEMEGLASPHALDEKGLDPNPFIELTTALERHQSQTQSTVPGTRGNTPFAYPPSQGVASAAYSDPESVPTDPKNLKLTIPPLPSLPPPVSASASQGPPPGPRIHYFPPRHPYGANQAAAQNDGPEQFHPISTTQYYQPPHGHRRRPTESVTSSPGTGTVTTESSPDTGTRMLPAVSGDSNNRNSGARASGGFRLSGFLSNLRARSMRATHDVPGAIIYEHERAGLPSQGRRVGHGATADESNGDAHEDGSAEVEIDGGDVEAYARSQARNIIRAHTFSRATKKNQSKKPKESRRSKSAREGREGHDHGDWEKVAMSEKLGSLSKGPGTKMRDYGNAEIDRNGLREYGEDEDGLNSGYTTAATESDVERDGDSLSLNSQIMPLPSGGVLGALLALYNAQNDGALDSLPPSGATTPAAIDEPFAVSSRSRARKEARSMRRAERQKEHSNDPATDIEDEVKEAGTEEPSPMISPTSSVPPVSVSSHLPPGEDFRATATSKQGIASTARKLFRLGTFRPAQSRNAGGVFGSLIASTANISGAAAPTPSTLVPTVDKPGFKLSRYELDAKSKRDSDSESASPVRPGHHAGAKSLSHLEPKLQSMATGNDKGESSNGSELERISTTPAPETRPLSILVTSSGPLSPSIGSATGSVFSDQAHPHVMAHTPVSAYIPAPVDYFTPRHGSAAPSPPHKQVQESKGHSHSKTLSSNLFPGDGLTTPGGTPLSSIAKRAKWTGVLKDFPNAGSFGLPYKSGKSTPATTPGSTTTASERGDWSEGFGWNEKESREDRERREREKKERKKRKKAELFITRHVAQIIQRQEFICKLARSMMMFGGPAHRLQSQIQATARVLDIELSCMYLPDVMLISFEDSSTGTSLIKFIKQGSALNLGKLEQGYMIYWKVIHDETSVSEASASLDQLMRRKPHYKWWHLMLIGGLCSAAICTVSFAGSFIDAVAVFPLGAILVGIQLLSVRNELYSNVFEITIATLFSFICGGLAASKRICYSATASSSIVLILPGFIVLSGGLEILSRNIVSGSVRMFYAVVYCLFLGFGLAMGAEAFQKVTGHAIQNLTDTSCSLTHNPDGPWWQRTPSKFWAFLTVPLFSLVLSMRNHQPLFSRAMLILVAISCIGWVVTYFVGLKFQNQADFSSAVGAFAIGMISNLAGRFLNGNAFTIMITGILFQVPSGLGNNGLLVFVSQQTNDSGTQTAYLSGFQTALQLISVAIGLTIGLGIALFLSHPIPSRRRAGGVFSL